MPTNLLENPSFELDAGGTNPPSSWSNFNSPANITRAVATDQTHGGTKSWKVATTDGNTADCGIQQSEFTRGSGIITLEPSTHYYFSSYIKTALTTGQAHVHIKLFDAGYANEAGYDTAEVTGTTDWILNDLTFKTTSTQVIAEVWLCFGAYGAASNGTAWFDDVVLEKVEVAEEESVTVSESTTIRLDSNLAKSESITVAEAVQIALSGPQVVVSDSISVTESVARVLESNPRVSDSISLTESVTSRLESNLVTSDSIAVAEAIQRMLESNSAVSDSISLSESLKSEQQSHLIPTDSISIAESISVSIEAPSTYELAVSDSVAINESFNAVLSDLTLSLSVSDSITTTDSVVQSLPISVAVTDSLGVTDTVGMFTDILYTSVSDSIAITERISFAPEYLKNQPFYYDIGQKLSIMLGSPRTAIWGTTGRPTEGLLPGTYGFNDELNQIEVWTGSQWLAFPGTPI